MRPPPDSALTREAETWLRLTARPALVNHCLRSFRWAVELATLDRIPYDPELLFTAAALHDIGLTERLDTGAAFEHYGGRVVRELTMSHGRTPTQSDATAAAVVHHMAPDITLDHGAETYLLWHATGLDVSGTRLDELPGPVVARVLSDHPWLDFTELFGRLLERQAHDKPGSRARELVDDGLLERLAACPLGHAAAESDQARFSTGRRQP